MSKKYIKKYNKSNLHKKGGRERKDHPPILTGQLWMKSVATSTGVIEGGCPAVHLSHSSSAGCLTSTAVGVMTQTPWIAIWHSTRGSVLVQFAGHLLPGWWRLLSHLVACVMLAATIGYSGVFILPFYSGTGTSTRVVVSGTLCTNLDCIPNSAYQVTFIAHSLLLHFLWWFGV